MDPLPVTSSQLTISFYKTLRNFIEPKGSTQPFQRSNRYHNLSTNLNIARNSTKLSNIQYAIDALLAALQINMQTSAADQHVPWLVTGFLQPLLESGVGLGLCCVAKANNPPPASNHRHISLHKWSTTKTLMVISLLH